MRHADAKKVSRNRFFPGTGFQPLTQWLGITCMIPWWSQHGIRMKCVGKHCMLSHRCWHHRVQLFFFVSNNFSFPWTSLVIISGSENPYEGSRKSHSWWWMCLCLSFWLQPVDPSFLFVLLLPPTPTFTMMSNGILWAADERTSSRGSSGSSSTLSSSEHGSTAGETNLLEELLRRQTHLNLYEQQPDLLSLQQTDQAIENNLDQLMEGDVAAYDQLQSLIEYLEQDKQHEPEIRRVQRGDRSLLIPSSIDVLEPRKLNRIRGSSGRFGYNLSRSSPPSSSKFNTRTSNNRNKPSLRRFPQSTDRIRSQAHEQQKRPESSQSLISGPGSMALANFLAQSYGSKDGSIGVRFGLSWGTGWTATNNTTLY